MKVSSTGVGFLGCGPATQAIHLPTLDRFRGTFHIAVAMDIAAAPAAEVARRSGSRWTTDVQEVLTDDEAEVVVVCGPHAVHAEHVIAACRAGKRAVLCEKPLAMSRTEAEAVAEAVADTGVPVLVGAMHTFDPAWVTVQDHWLELPAEVHTIRYSVVLPPNPRFEDFSTEIMSRPDPAVRNWREPREAADMVRSNIMGLAIHDLPLVRAFCSSFRDVEVRSAQALRPGGALVNLRVGTVDVQVYGVHTALWHPEWRFEAVSDSAHLVVDFPPSYVHAGSATATLRDGDGTRSFGPYRANGYEEEWRYLAGLLAGRRPPIDITDLVDDVSFALDIADKAATAVEGQVHARVATR